MEKSLKRQGLVFTGLTLVAFIIAFLAPLSIGIYLSFIRFTTMINATFNGMNNHVGAFSECQGFISALAFAAVVTIIAIISVNVFVFMITYLLTWKLRGTNFFRIVFFTPNLVEDIVLGYTWQTIINMVLHDFNTTLVMDARYRLLGLILPPNWQQVGYMMVIYTAGLQPVPPELVEAAQIGGASRWQIMRNVVIPMIMPFTIICIFLTLSSLSKLSDQNLALTSGAPQRAVETAALNTINTFFGEPGYGGVGQAKAVVFFPTVALVAFLQPRLACSKEAES